MRGASVGAAAGVVSIAAHALGGGMVTPGSAAVALLVAACTLIGVLVAAAGGGLPRLLVLLAVGHGALSVAPGHCHPAVFSPGMLVAHLVAVPVGAVAVRGAEVALRRVLSRVWRVVGARRLLWSSGVGRRGPPGVVAGVFIRPGVRVFG
ncbi:hypothetical protein IU476_03855 [Nocardia blacklockiae]|nr:hypothetical protein [Nocardia blacklockiae]